MEQFRGGKSGVGGLLSKSGFGFGNGVIMGCKPEDTSFFCRFARIFQIIMMTIALLIVAAFIYGLVSGKASLFGGAVKSMRKSLT